MAVAIIDELIQQITKTSIVDEKSQDDFLVWGYSRRIVENTVEIPEGIIDLIKEYKLFDPCGIWRNTDNGNLARVCMTNTIKTYFINGGNNMMILTKEGELFCVGDNRNGEFGMRSDTAPFAEIEDPIRHNFFGTGSGKLIKLISEGIHGAHSFVVLENNQIYSFGNNDCGQLGINSIDDVKTVDIPVKIENFAVSLNIKSIICGASHSILLTSSPSNNIWSCGKNNIGQLGLNDTVNRQIFCRLNSFSNNAVRYIDCGINSSYCIDKGFNIWSWGCVDLGRLGLGKGITDHQLTPIKIPYFTERNIKINQLSAGDRYVCVLSVDSDVFTFGHNDNGQCGNGTTDNVFAPYKVMLNLRNKVKKVTSGSNTTFILDDGSNLYVFGAIKWGEGFVDPEKHGVSLLNPLFVSFQTLKAKMKDENIYKIMDIKAAAYSFIISN